MTSLDRTARWEIQARRARRGDFVLAVGTDEFEPRPVEDVSEDGETVTVKSKDGVRLSIPWHQVYVVEVLK